MATMLPPWLPHDVVPGERRVFEELRDNPISNDWIVLHSYCLSRHLYQERGEIDFVVIAPGLGVMVVEVKSHRSVRYDGLWFLGQDPPTAKSPFDQAKNNMYSIKNLILDAGRQILAIDYCVTFPLARFDHRSPEWHDWQLVDSTKAEARGLTACIRAAFTGHFSASGTSEEYVRQNFTLENAHSLAEFLRPRFELSESLASRNNALNREYKVFLEEQFEALDQLDTNEQMLFEGAAGTGKTLLALEAARRALLTDQKVLVLCFNRQLGKFLNSELGDNSNLVFCGTVAALMHRLTKKSQESPTIDFSALVADSIEVISEGMPTELNFDVLIVDEIQDIASGDSMDFLEFLIETAGAPKLRFFGDLEYQKLYFNQAGSRDLLFQRFPHLVPFHLWSNCRNRPELENLIEGLCDFKDLYRRFRLPSTGPIMNYATFRDESEKIAQMEGALEALLRDFLPGEIVVIGEELFQGRRSFSQSLAGRFYESDEIVVERTKILSTTIRKFKGLEAKAVLIHDFNASMDAELLYAAITRAIEKIAFIGRAEETTLVASKLLPR